MEPKPCPSLRAKPVPLFEWERGGRRNRANPRQWRLSFLCMRKPRQSRRSAVGQLRDMEKGGGSTPPGTTLGRATRPGDGKRLLTVGALTGLAGSTPAPSARNEHRSVLLGEHAASKTASQGSNPCT